MTQVQRWANTAQTDHVTLRATFSTFDLGGDGACGCMMRVVVLHWRAMCVSINGPDDLDL